MLIQLAIEVWMDILEWLRRHRRWRRYRRELAAKVNQLGDRTFSQFCQHWLHKYTKDVQLGSLFVDSEFVLNKDGLQKRRGVLTIRGHRGRERVRVPFAQVPMPENVTGFQQIEINYLDWEVVNLLQYFFTHNNYNNINSVHLDINFGISNGNRSALNHLLPLLNNGIGRMNLCLLASSRFPSILRKFSDQLFSAKLLRLSISVEFEFHQLYDFVRWLCANRADGEPRMAVLFQMPAAIWRRFYEVIHEQFRAATSPVSFFVDISALRSLTVFRGLNITNRKTGERLVIQQQGPRNFWIGRCPANVDGNAWLQEMDQRATAIMGQQKSRRIWLNQPSLGTMEPEEDEEEGNGNDDDVDQQPGPSKKRKLI